MFHNFHNVPSVKTISYINSAARHSFHRRAAGLWGDGEKERERERRGREREREGEGETEGEGERGSGIGREWESASHTLPYKI